MRKKTLKFNILMSSILLTQLMGCLGKNNIYNNTQDYTSVPMININLTPVVDLDSVEKYDQRSLIPEKLTLGVEHPIVTSIQARLMQLGYLSDEDKATIHYGEDTVIAIKRFQRQNGLVDDGICTNKVYDMLMDKNAKTYEARRGRRGEDISIIQQRLYELGYLLYENDINGYFGAKTEAAIKEMQSNNKLNATGVMDLNTYHLLYSENVTSYTINKKSPAYIVKTYQEKLQDLGYFFGECDGTYTDAFRQAVRNYQIHNSQNADGFIGSATKFSLDSNYSRPFFMFLGNRNESVKIIQQRLVDLNYIEQRLVTGYFGEFTAQAIALFQKTNNLPVTGMIDGASYTILNSEFALVSPIGPLVSSKQFVMKTDDIKKAAREKQKMGNVDDLIKVATMKLGSKYVWGSKGPNTFDCSGFVFWCLNQVGMNVSYMTTYNWQFSTQFEKIERFEDLIPGDLVIVNGHMGIVSDNQTVIDASSSNGKVVHRDLDDWWRQRFIMGFRIFEENNTNQVEAS